MKKSRKKVSRKKVARKKKVLVIRTGTRSTSELQAELFKELKARWKEVDARYLPGGHMVEDYRGATMSPPAGQSSAVIGSIAKSGGTQTHPWPRYRKRAAQRAASR